MKFPHRNRGFTTLTFVLIITAVLSLYFFTEFENDALLLRALATVEKSGQSHLDEISAESVTKLQNILNFP